MELDSIVCVRMFSMLLQDDLKILVLVFVHDCEGEGKELWTSYSSPGCREGAL